MPADDGNLPNPMETEALANRHPGLLRFAEEMRRNQPGISDEEIAELFEAWSR